jgi:hypothetical protein
MNNSNIHVIITTDSCIHIQKSRLNIPNLLDKFNSVLSKMDQNECYAHIFNCNLSHFPVSISSINKDSYEKYVNNICLSIYIGFLSAVDMDAIDYDDNFYVFISKDSNDKLELMNI